MAGTESSLTGIRYGSERCMLPIAFVLFITFLCAGCVATFKENHYFQAIDSKTKQPTNYYRLRVEGDTQMSSARYISGYYDERAVDLFFNEIKVAPTPETATGVRKLFEDNIKAPGTQEVIMPLTPDDQHGAFVMILSTNASAVSNAIGQFAESQVVADAVTNLANRDVILSSLRTARVIETRAGATASELQSLFALVPDGDSPDKEQTRLAYLRILNAIAQSIDSQSDSFTSLPDAFAWFQQKRREVGL